MTHSAPPLIGITTYGINRDNEFTVPADYVESIRRAQGVPVLMPPGEARTAVLAGRIDAFILAGGGDIDPSLYGGRMHETVYNVDRTRDEMEIALALEVVRGNVPTLAICRGMQIVNVALGGTLHVHLPDVFGDAVLHRAPPREPVSHSVKVVKDSCVADIMHSVSVTSVSWHHQAIRDVAPGLDVVATAPDGVMEAVEMKGHPWLIGVQWHPELTSAADDAQQRLFTCLVHAASALHGRRVS